MSNYPTSLDDTTIFPSISANTSRAAGGNYTHSVYHGNMNAAVIAMEAKVGINSSTDLISFENLFRYDLKTRRPRVSIFSDSEEFDGTSLTGWSWTRQGTASYTVANGSLNYTTTYTGASCQPQLHKALPAGTAWRFETCIHYNNFVDGYQGAGMFIREDSTDKWIPWTGYFSDNSVTKLNRLLSHWTGTTNDGDVFFVDSYSFDNPVYLAIERAGSNLYFEISRTGIANTWHRAATIAVTTYFTTAPDRIGFHLYKFTGTTNNPAYYPNLSIPYLRRVS